MIFDVIFKEPIKKAIIEIELGKETPWQGYL